jgi:predicted TIM-barrel fold metal-dependent hydrolase
MPDLIPVRTVIVKPGQSFCGKTGENLTIITPTPRCIVDSHSHIENGACAPLPLLWDKLPLQPHLERKWIDKLAKVVKSSTGHLQVKSTTEIGNCAVAAIDETFGLKSIIGQSDLYRDSDLFTFLVMQMMDMEYAHLAGYSGQTIYHEDESPWYYYERQSGKDPENKGKKILLLGENQKTFSKWKDQYLQTVAAMKINPLRLIGMYNYAPPRWNYSKSTFLDGNFQRGPWNHPLNQIATKTNQGLFIGIKVYPSLGHKPLDEHFPYMHDRLKDGDCFYARCEREGIPILSHCSPGGMTTHELPFYMEYNTLKPTYSAQSQFMPSTVAPADATNQVSSDDTPEKAANWFYENHVHPRAWRKVLQQFPKLKLCLAHFGGELFPLGTSSEWVKEIIDLTKEYPNVYTDFSCWDLGKSKETFAALLANEQNKHLKDKVLFGTDWYMTLVALGGKSYRKFVEEFWDFFNEIPDGISLWTRFTFLNPFEFYGFNDPDILNNMIAALKTAKCDPDKLQDNSDSFHRMQNAFKKQREKLPKQEGI